MLRVAVEGGRLLGPSTSSISWTQPNPTTCGRARRRRRLVDEMSMVQAQGLGDRFRGTNSSGRVQDPQPTPSQLRLRRQLFSI